MYTIVPRERYGLDPVVRSSNGSPRPLVRKPAAYVTWHYTGVNVRWGDVGDTEEEIRAIERYAASVNKPNEYNFVIHQDDDLLLHEYAGGYRAAHSAGENSISYGILLLNGTQEPLTPRQIDKARWFRSVLLATKSIDSGTSFRGHRDMPGAATLCPGTLIYPHVHLLDDPWPGAAPEPEPKPPTEPTNPVPVDPPDADGVGYYLITDRKTPWSISAECYGTGTRYPEIMAANDPDTTPNPGERWAVPGFKGIWTEVKSGEGPWAILDRVFGSNGWNKSTGVDQFWQWNGGDPNNGGRMFNGTRVALQPGERVWLRA